MEIGKQVPAMFREMVEEMLEQNKALIIDWLIENKDLVKKVIEN